VRRRAERLRGRAVHLALDDLRMNPVAAVVHGGVVDDLIGTRLGVDFEHADMDLARVGQRQVAVLPLLVRHLERRHVDVAAVEGHVTRFFREDRVVRVDDRADPHERDRRLRVLAQLGEAALELNLVLGHAAENGGRDRSDLAGELIDGALDRPEAGNRELARIRPGEAGVGVPVSVVARAHGDIVGRDSESIGDDLRCGRLVALSLRNRAERDDDLAEDVELDRRHLVVAGELQVRIQELRLPEVVRARVERRGDPNPSSLPRDSVSRASVRSSYPMSSSATSSARVVAGVVDAAVRRLVRISSART
jgi:hypothetical protein